MTRSSIFIILLTLLSISCDHTKSELVKNVDVTNSPIEGELSSLIESYEIIPLENTPNAYMNNPGGETFTDSLIIFRNGDKKIVIFNKSGKYLNSISKQGRGPDEYQFINGFTFNTSDKLVSIRDNNKIKRFNLNGDFIDETELGFRSSVITRFGPDQFIVEKMLPSGDSISDYYIRLVNKEFTTISARLPIKPLGGPGFGIEGQIYRTMVNGDHAYFFSYFADTVYHIDNKSIKPAYSFIYDKNIISVTNGTGEYEFNPDQAYRYICFYELADLNLLFYSFNNNNYCLAFNSSNTISKVYNASFAIRNVVDDRGIIIYENFLLGKLIERIDPNKTKCSNPEVLNKTLDENERDGQCIIKVSFRPL